MSRYLFVIAPFSVGNKEYFSNTRWRNRYVGHGCMILWSIVRSIPVSISLCMKLHAFLPFSVGTNIHCLRFHVTLRVFFIRIHLASRIAMPEQHKVYYSFGTPWISSCEHFIQIMEFIHQRKGSV